jgi:hypothetical protein
MNATCICGATVYAATGPDGRTMMLDRVAKRRPARVEATPSAIRWATRC